MADKEDFIVNYDFGHYIWTAIKNAPYVDWEGDDDVQYALINPNRSQRYKRNAGSEYQSPDEWVDAGGVPLKMHLEYARDYNNFWTTGMKIAGASTTELGTRFWFEYSQDSDTGEVQPALANPIRIPAPSSFSDTIREWARSYPNGEVTRVKSAVFEKRFADAGLGGSGSYAGETHEDFHVKIPDIATKSELEQVFDESLQIVQRVVRSER